MGGDGQGGGGVTVGFERGDGKEGYTELLACPDVDAPAPFDAETDAALRSPLLREPPMLN